jgi:hypothetical protein
MSKNRFTTLWRNQFLTSHAKTLDDMIEGLSAAVAKLTAMRDAGLRLEEEGGVAEDYATLFTEDAAVAAQFNFEQEVEDDLVFADECDPGEADAPELDLE